jgi:hypothetical protein
VTWCEGFTLSDHRPVRATIDLPAGSAAAAAAA